MTPTELADALASIPFDPSVTVSATHAAAILDASHALRRLGRVEDAAGRALRVLELEFNECGECVGAYVCTRCALSAALRAE